MTPAQVTHASDNLVNALAREDEEAGLTAALALVTGLALNVARIAEALCRPAADAPPEQT